jgi:hypothetical protein
MADAVSVPSAFEWLTPFQWLASFDGWRRL